MQLITEDGALNDIIQVFHYSYTCKVYWLKTRLIKLGCEAADSLLVANKPAIPYAIEPNGIADEIIYLLNQLEIHEIKQYHL